jgi:hypothetical protein
VAPTEVPAVVQVVVVAMVVPAVTVFVLLVQLRVFGHVQRSVQAHQRGHRSHVHQPLERLVVGVLEPVDQ